MDFVEQTSIWVKSEVLQGRIMVGLGIILIVVLMAILRSSNELLRGTLIPLGLLLLVLIGYGCYILYSRPAFATQSIARFEQSEEAAIVWVREKHITDNKAGNTLIKAVYPSFMLLSVLALFVVSPPFYKGLALGSILLFVGVYIIDSGFVSRSNAFITYLNEAR
jgi:hypothetical protein